MSKPERKKSAGQNTGDEQPTRERTEGMREREDGKNGEERMEKEWERRDKTTKRQRDNTKRREKEKVEEKIPTLRLIENSGILGCSLALIFNPPKINHMGLALK